MPSFHGIDFFAKQKSYQQKQLQKLLLPQNAVPSISIQGEGDYQIYKKPWHAFQVDRNLFAQASLEDSSYLLSLISNLRPAELAFELQPEDVTQGLTTEDFTGFFDNLDYPLIASEPQFKNSVCYTEDKIFASLKCSNREQGHFINGGRELYYRSNEFSQQRHSDFFANDGHFLQEPIVGTDSTIINGYVPGSSRIDEIVNSKAITSKPMIESNEESQEVRKCILPDISEGISLLDHPVISSTSLTYEKNRFSSLDMEPIKVTEDVIDLSEWNLNLIEPCPSLFNALLLKHPDICLNSPPKKYQLGNSFQPVKTDPCHLQSLVWNPFYINSVSTNVQDTLNSLKVHFVPPKTSKTDNITSTTLLKELFQPYSEQKIEFQENALCEGSSEDRPSYVEGTREIPIPRVKCLPKVSATNKNLDLKDSVANFMNLRKKEPSKDVKVLDCSAPVVISAETDEKLPEIIECTVDEFTAKFVARICDFCKNHLKVLCSRGVLKDSAAFLNISEAALDFSLKECINCNDEIACNSLLKLIPIKRAIYLALQFDTEASLDFLKSIKDNDPRFSLCMNDLSQIQFEIVLSGHKISKVIKVCDIVAQSSGVNLILISQGRQNKSRLIDLIVKVGGVPVAPTVTFPNFNCYLYNSEDITPDFPWKRFGTIIEYNEVSSCLKPTIRECNAEHYVLKTVIPSQEEIASQNLTELNVIAYSLDFKVLRCLEAEYSFVVYQRQAVDQFSHETLIIDERTCIVVIKDLNEIKQVRLLSSLFVKISLMYRFMNLIFDISTCHHSELYSVVFASLAHFHPDKLKINTYYCLSVNEICKRITKITLETKENIDVNWKSTDLWLKRTWLTEEESNHEKILTKIPCINSYVAQIMLTTHSLSELFNLRLNECIENMPVISKDILTQFHETIHSEKANEHNRTVHFDTQPSIQEYTPTPVESPQPMPSVGKGYHRTSIPPLMTSFNMADALGTSYKTPKMVPTKTPLNVAKTPVKPHNIVRPFSSASKYGSAFRNNKRAVEEKHKHSFSYSKHRKVMVDKYNVNGDGQATLFIDRP